MLKTKAIPAVIAGALVLAPTLALADEHDDRAGLSAFGNAKVSLPQAIAAAEQELSGKAFRADLEDQNGKLLYEVAVLKDGTAHKVKVNAELGKILASATEAQDREGDGEDEE